MAMDLHLGAHEGEGNALAPDPNIDSESNRSSTDDPLDDIKSGLKVWADVGLTLGKSINENTKATRRLWDRLQHGTPVDYGIGVAGVYPASGNLLLNFGSPDQGTRWEVTGVVLGGVDSNTVAAGQAGLYVSGQLPAPGGAAPAGITALADRAPTLPDVAFYGTRQLVVNDQEYLFAIIFGGTPGQTYAGNFSTTVFWADAGGGRDMTVL